MPVLLLLVLVGVVTAVVLVRHGDTYARGAPGGAAPAPAAAAPAPARPGAGLRVLAGCAGAGAAVLYIWGALCVAGAVMEAEDGGTGSAPLRPCRTSEHPELSGRIVDYSVSYLPLRFDCETADGDGYASDDVPGYVNSGVAVLALTAAGSAVAAGYATELRARARRRPVTGPSNTPGGPV
ncbi:hypothetical protein [Streptomyces sp. DH41]|uniref:hypothetical protein n=1 Tax=Streptomyces sp. DH41 TaxID=3040125 RepID=UPI0024419AF7|nr:hypothetical protein [Streptomyces sp. DH41]MDG9728494.1 hypothetical protein [Streptomyces sp. DH41]